MKASEFRAPGEMVMALKQVVERVPSVAFNATIFVFRAFNAVKVATPELAAMAFPETPLATEVVHDESE